MNTLQIASIIFIFLIQLIIPILFVCWIWFKKSKSTINLILKLMTVWSFFIYIFYAGNWNFLPYLLRYIFLLLLIGSTIKAVRQFKGLPFLEKKKIWGWTKFVGQFFFSLFFFLVSVKVISGFWTDEKGIDIAFPLKEGVISHGGNSRIINYHQADTTAQHYALDIVKLNGSGLRTTGFFPVDLNEYAIYGDTIFAPCDGKVVKIQDGLDNVPPRVDVKVNPAGNHIVLQYQNNLIVFAHILKTSISVSNGDFVKKGQPIARVGNSGHTTEPHLHIHAISGTDTSKIIKGGGHGIPIYFDGRFLTRNDRVKNKKLFVSINSN